MGAYIICSLPLIALLAFVVSICLLFKHRNDKGKVKKYIISALISIGIFAAIIAYYLYVINMAVQYM